jgi:hypothetical protein
MNSIQITEVINRSQFKDFINLPWRIYKDYPNWAPPLKKEVASLLDVNCHPFWLGAERKLLIARQGPHTVGRLAVIIDKNFINYHKSATGYWGFFESVDDRDVAEALFAAGEDWLSKKGMTKAIGPFNPSTNYEIGLLISGYEHRATFMMPYNPPYYTDLVQYAGYDKEKDLLSLIVTNKTDFSPWVRRLVEQLKSKGDFSVRTVRMDKLRDDVGLIKEIYDECWKDNWGFVPMTDQEMDGMVENLRKIADPDMLFFIERQGSPIGAALIVPDINPLLMRLNGKIGILGLIRYLRHKKEITGLRGLLFGVKPKYRNMGAPFLAFDYLNQISRVRTEYNYLELGWNLEDNEDINLLERDCGAKLFKKYRIYSKPLAII